MRIKAVEPVSTLDWPGEVCSVFFSAGCNFKCPWCFNKELVPMSDSGMTINEAIDMVPKHIDHIILTGGEVFHSPAVSSAVHLLKRKGYKVGVHTNGSYPQSLDSVIYSLDYVAMDIKGTLDKYPERTGVRCVNTDLIMDSIVSITERGFSHEFRTTAVPGVTESEIRSIAGLLSFLGARKYYLQVYKPVKGGGEGAVLTREDLAVIAKSLPLETQVRG